jgi:hypothetical protein
MRKQYLASLASLLLGASCVYGQAKDAAPAKDAMPAQNGAPAHAPEPGPMPNPVATDDPDGGSQEEPKPVSFAAPGPKTAGAFTGEIDYLLWWLANSHDNIPMAANNILSTPGVSVLDTSGDAEHANRAPISGARLTLGYWQVDENPWIPGGIRDFGIETTLFFISQVSANFKNDESPELVRPFFDINNRQESGFIVAEPGLATGSINAHAQANLWGGEVNVWKNIYYNFPGSNYTVSALAGFRYLSADELVEIGSTSVFNQNLAPSSPYFAYAGNKLDVFDSFATHNRFYGGQAGISSKGYLCKDLCVEFDFKLALGVTVEDVTVAGGQLRTFANGSTQTYNGGLLALPSNIGTYNRDVFSQVPELDLKFAYDLTKHINFSTGFTVIYWNRIARAADQIDRELDITQIPNFPGNAGATPTGLGRPAVPLAESDIWALGFSIGVEFKW